MAMNHHILHMSMDWMNEDYICFILHINLSSLCDKLFMRISKYDLNLM
jgi:hypothetical protein